MKGFCASGLGQTRRWVILGLLTAAVCAVTILATAKRVEVPGWFQHVESGINHAQLPCDAHHICGTAMNSLLGHCTVTIALVKSNSGIIEYRLPNGDTIYGTVEFKATSTSGLSIVNVHFTGGTGRFQNQVAGTATGTIQETRTSLGVRTYTANLTGALPGLRTSMDQ